MGGTSADLAEVAGERADVGARAAMDLDLEVFGMAAEDAPLVNGDAHGLQLHRLAAPGGRVRSHAGDALGGKRRWPLQQMAREGADSPLDDRLFRSGSLGHRLAFEIVRRRAESKANRREIDLGLGVEKGQEPRG